MNASSARLKYTEASAPDDFEYEIGTRPGADFVLSRNLDGEVISRYGHHQWDFAPYCRPTQKARYINFPIAVNEQTAECVADLKWLTFVILYHRKGRRRGAVTTLVKYFRFLLVAYDFAIGYQISLCGLFANKKTVKAFHATLPSYLKKALVGALRSYSKITEKELGFRSISLTKGDLRWLKNKSESNISIKQTSVIPERIYACCAQELTARVEDFNSNSELLTEFVYSCIGNCSYAKSITTQKQNGLRAGSYQPDFKSAACIHGVESYFSRHGIKSLSGLCHHLLVTQFRCKTLVHMYSGMRDEEVLSTKYDCVQTVTVKRLQVLRLIGVTTKLEKGEERTTNWITCPEVLPAIKAARCICKLIADANHISPEGMNLFITPTHLPFSQRHQGTAKLTQFNFVLSNLKHHIFNDEVFHWESFTITHEDHKFLKRLDFSRNWDAETNFQVGKTWPFASHQFRRSLAVYSLSSRIVSLMSLRRQLKHISTAMTLYYVKGNLHGIELFGLNDSFKEEILALRETVSALDYINLAFCPQQLKGTHGKHLEQHIKPLSEDAIMIFRDETVKRANRGEFRFKNTHMGGCVSPVPCGKPLLAPLTSCLKCAKSVIDPDAVAETIEVTKSRLDTMQDGPEKTTLKLELSNLLKFME